MIVLHMQLEIQFNLSANVGRIIHKQSSVLFIQLDDDLAIKKYDSKYFSFVSVV